MQGLPELIGQSSDRIVLQRLGVRQANLCSGKALLSGQEAVLAMDDHTLRCRSITWVTFIFIFCLGVRSP